MDISLIESSSSFIFSVWLWKKKTMTKMIWTGKFYWEFFLNARVVLERIRRSGVVDKDRLWVNGAEWAPLFLKKKNTKDISNEWLRLDEQWRRRRRTWINEVCRMIWWMTKPTFALQFFSFSCLFHLVECVFKYLNLINRSLRFRSLCDMLKVLNEWENYLE